MLLVLLLVLALFSSYSLSTSSLRAWQKQKGIMKSTTAMHHLEKPFHARGKTTELPLVLMISNIVV